HPRPPSISTARRSWGSSACRSGDPLPHRLPSGGAGRTVRPRNALPPSSAARYLPALPGARPGDPGMAGRAVRRMRDAGSALIETILEVGVLDGDLAVLEREDVAAGDLDLLAVRGCAREEPLGDATVACDEVAGLVEVGIGEELEDLGEGIAHSFAPLVAGSACLLARS